MKNNEHLFADFIALAVIAGIANSFSKKEESDKPNAEKDTAEKQCKCGNNCKNTTPDFCKEDLLKNIDESLKLLASDKQITDEGFNLLIYTLTKLKKYIA